MFLTSILIMLIYFVIICPGKYVSVSCVFPLIKTEDNYLRMEVYIQKGFTWEDSHCL